NGRRGWGRGTAASRRPTPPRPPAPGPSEPTAEPDRSWPLPRFRVGRCGSYMLSWPSGLVRGRTGPTARMLRYRRFRNDDPPALVAIWNESATGRGAYPLHGTAALERAAF